MEIKVDHYRAGLCGVAGSGETTQTEVGVECHHGEEIGPRGEIRDVARRSRNGVDAKDNSALEILKHFNGIIVDRNLNIG